MDPTDAVKQARAAGLCVELITQYAYRTVEPITGREVTYHDHKALERATEEYKKLRPYTPTERQACATVRVGLLVVAVDILLEGSERVNDGVSYVDTDALDNLRKTLGALKVPDVRAFASMFEAAGDG